MIEGLLTIALAFASSSEGYPLDDFCLSKERMDPPHFPAEEFRRGKHGVVGLEVEAVGCGRVQSVRVLKSSGSSQLDNAAVKRAWKWHMPFSLNQESKPARWSVQVTFPAPIHNPGLSLQAKYDRTSVVVSAPFALISEAGPHSKSP